MLLTLGAGGFGALILAAALPTDTVLLGAILCLTAGLFALAFPRTRRRRCALGAGLLAAGFALGLFVQKEIADYRPAVAKAGQIVWIEATVAEPPAVSDEQLLCRLCVTSGDLKPGTRLLYGMPWDGEPPAVGDTVTGVVRLGLSEPAVSEPAGLLSGKASGVYLTAWPQNEDSAAVCPSDPDPAERSVGDRLTAFLRAFRENTRTRLTAALPDDARAIVSAMCLGDRSGLTDSETDAFRRSGVSHLLVVSGLHISVVAMGIYTLFRRTGCRKRTAAIAAMAALGLFACLIGWHASVVRACVLNAAVLLGRCFRRPADSVNSLGGGLLLLWLHDPFCVYDLGLWLSFGATAGLIFLYPWLWRHVSGRLSAVRPRSRAGRTGMECIRGAVRVFCVTLAATLPTLPLTACFFGEVSLISPLTNLLTVWAAAAMLYLACAMFLLCGTGLSAVAAVPAAPMTALSRYLAWVTRTLSGVWGAVWNTRSAYIRAWIIGGLLLLWLGWRLCKGRGLRVAAAVCVIVLCAGTLLYTVRMQGVTTLTAYNRYGQTTVAIQQDGRAIVIVSGLKRSWKNAAYWLRERNITEVDAVIVTDPAELPGDEWLSFDERIRVGRYWLTELDADTAARLMTGRAPVSVAAWIGDQPVRFGRDGAWRWDRGSGALDFSFGETRLWVWADDLADRIGGARGLTMTVSAWVGRQEDDTPLSGERQTWYTRGKGEWVP